MGHSQLHKGSGIVIVSVVKDYAANLRDYSTDKYKQTTGDMIYGMQLLSRVYILLLLHIMAGLRLNTEVMYRCI